MIHADRRTRQKSETLAPGVVPGHSVKLRLEPARVGMPHHDQSCEPKVELVHVDEVIRAIDITCSCGQRIRLRCDY